MNRGFDFYNITQSNLVSTHISIDKLNLSFLDYPESLAISPKRALLRGVNRVRL